MTNSLGRANVKMSELFFLKEYPFTVFKSDCYPRCMCATFCLVTQRLFCWLVQHISVDESTSIQWVNILPQYSDINLSANKADLEETAHKQMIRQAQ